MRSAVQAVIVALIVWLSVGLLRAGEDELPAVYLFEPWYLFPSLVVGACIYLTLVRLKERARKYGRSKGEEFAREALIHMDVEPPVPVPKAAAESSLVAELVGRDGYSLSAIIKTRDALAAGLVLAPPAFVFEQFLRPSGINPPMLALLATALVWTLAIERLGRCKIPTPVLSFIPVHWALFALTLLAGIGILLPDTGAPTMTSAIDTGGNTLSWIAGDPSWVHSRRQLGGSAHSMSFEVDSYLHASSSSGRASDATHEGRTVPSGSVTSGTNSTTSFG